jgi:hypothetical protein
MGFPWPRFRKNGTPRNSLKRIHRDGKLPLNITGFEIQGEMQAIAFMVVTDENMIQVRDAQTASRRSLRRIIKKFYPNVLQIRI